jgi:tetratricopeptide (TPR) repeat protein
MTSPTQFHVFLSAVSSEFRQERMQLEIWLERKGLHVSSQEKFNQGGSTLWQKLHDEVDRCQAVICIMGMEPGWPSSGELPDGAPERSWTQWEFWLAWGEAPWSPPRREKVFVFFPADLEQRMEKARTAASGDSNRLHALDLQQAHIDKVKDTNKHYSTFAGDDDLIKQCLVLDLPTIQRTKPSNLKYATLGTLFKGRSEKLEELHRNLTVRPRQVIHGLGGTGKTRFVVEYALRHAEEYQALLFVSADKPEALYRNLATLCGPDSLDLPEKDVKEEAARYRAVIRWLQTHQGWLLILDNVDTAESAQAFEELVGSLQGGTVLITSRLADWSNEIPTLDLDELAESAAVEFLLERTQDKRRRLPTDTKDAQALAHELGRLALALEQAGAFIAQKRSSLTDYLARWRQRDEAVRKWNDERLTKYLRAVVTTWDTTVEQLSLKGLALLRQLSWLAAEPIPRSILPDGPAQDALGELAGFSLAKFEEGGERFRIHRLVQDVTRERQSGEERDQSLRSMLETFNKAECGDPQDVRSWPVWDPLHPHLSSVTTYADQYGIADPTTSLMNQLGVLLLSKASYGDAEPLMRRALAIDEASYGPDHLRVAIDLNNLAQLLQGTNRLTEAEPLMQRALAIDEASYGPDHLRVAIDLNNLAQLLKDTNRLTEAEPLMQRALAIDEAGYGPNHPRVATRLNNLVQLFHRTSRLAKAEPLMQRALAIDEAGYGPNHPTVAGDLNNLAQLLQATNRLEEAEPLMQRALAIDEVSYGPDHPRVAGDLNNLAQLLQDTNRLTEAEPLMQRALAIDEASYGPDHPNVARDLNNLALLLRATNRLDDAEPLMQRHLVILFKFTRSTGHVHPHLKQACENYRSLLQALDLSDEEVLERLLSLGVDAGFDAGTYRPLIAALLS